MSRRYLGDSLPAWAAPLDLEGVRRLVTLLEEEMKKRDFRFVIGDGVLYLEQSLSEPTRYFLPALVAACAKAPADRWPALVAGQIDEVLRAEEEQTRFLSEVGDFEKVKGRIKVRLFPSETLQTDAAKQVVMRQVADGIAAAPMFDLPSALLPVNKGHVAAWKMNEDQLFPIGLNNLVAAGPVRVQELRDEGGPKILALGGDSPLIATHLFFLERYFEKLPEHGILVCVPTCHTVLLHPIVDAEAGPALRVLVPAAIGMHRQGPNSVSPHVYWWRNRNLTKLEAKIEGENIEFFPPPDLVAALKQVGAQL